MPSKSSGYSDIVSEETDEQVDLETDRVIGGVGSGRIDLRADERETGVITDGGGGSLVFGLLLLFSNIPFLGTDFERGIAPVCVLTGLSSLVVESQLMIVFKREISCLAVVTCLRNVSILMILMSVLVSYHVLLMRLGLIVIHHLVFFWSSA